MHKILIIVLRYTPYKEKSYYEFPLGLAYVSASLKKAGHFIRVLNLNHHDGTQFDLIKSALADGDIKYVLLGGLSAHYRQLKSIVNDVRSVRDDVVVIVGGGVVTSTPELMYDHLGPDCIVLGEGESTIVELVNELDNGGRHLGDVRGIGYRNGSGNFVTTPPRAPIMDLDALPWPDLEGFEFETYLDMQRPNDSLYLYINDKPRFYPIISSRGCPYNCTFCYHPLGQKYRSRSVDNFIGEVEYVCEKYNVNNLAIFDELISADRNRLFEICERLSAMPRKLNWMCQLRVDKVDEEMLETMKAAGCFIISYGFESANDDVLKSMNKHITKAQIQRAMELTRKAGIGIQGYFIFGDPCETRETARETLDFWKQHQSYHITMGYIRPYPGSVLWKSAISSGNMRTASQQLEFLDSCISAPPNLTKMNEAEWFELQKDVQKAIITNDHFGELVASKKNAPNDYSITIRCPHCMETVTYNNFHQRILGPFKIACRKCHQAMNMTPRAFEDSSADFSKNYEAFRTITSGRVPVSVTPCMNEAEFAAMADLFLNGARIVNFMDASEAKANRTYFGKPVLKRNIENIQSLCGGHYFLIPLTRFANRILDHLQASGVPRDHICRLDEIPLCHLELGPKEFADLFDLSVDELPRLCKKVIEDSDFRYRILSGAERENTILRVVKTLMSETLKVSGPHRRDDWERGWTENLESFVSHGLDVNELIPKFVRKKEVVRYKGNFILPADSNFETNFVRVLRNYLFSKYFKDATKVFEFGCGTGLNLIAISKLYPEKKLYGLDWSEASCEIVDKLSSKLGLDLSAVRFDMFSPDYGIELDSRSAVLTVGAMEQLGTNFMPFARFLLKKQPSVVINIEVNYEAHDRQSLFGFLAAAYIEKRNYLRGFFAYLHDLANQGLVSVLESRQTFGGLYHDGYAYTVWKPGKS